MRVHARALEGGNSPTYGYKNEYIVFEYTSKQEFHAMDLYVASIYYLRSV